MARIVFPDFQKLVDGLRVAIQPTQEDSAVLANESCNIIYVRTVRDGLDKFGREFLPYSTEPIYIGGEYYSLAVAAGGRTEYLKQGRGSTRGGKRYVRFTGAAETGDLRQVRERSGFKGQARTSKMRSVYFEGGYDQFARGVAGTGEADPSVVNLSKRGNLMGSSTFSAGSSDAAFGVEEATEKKFRLAFTRALEASIADGLIERGRDFWGIMEIQAERDLLQSILADRLRERVREAVREGVANAGR